MRSALSKLPKWLLFSVLAALGGVIMSLACEPLDLESLVGSRGLAILLETSVWTGLICLGLALPILMIQQILLSGSPSLSASVKPAGVALISGAVSGLVAQLLYNFLLGKFGYSLGELPRFPPWMLAGAGLGVSLSLAVPNLRLLPAGLLGALGGLVGVSGFVVIQVVGFDGVLARSLGVAAIGFFIGLAVSLAERISREGYLRVIWGPGEETTVNLGARAITVGTGKEVSVRLPASSRYPALVATFRLVGGTATLQNHMSGTNHALRDGNRLNLGPVSIEVRLFS